MTAESGGDQVEVLSLLDSAPDGVLVVDADGTVTFRATDPDAATITAELAKAGA